MELISNRPMHPDDKLKALEAAVKELLRIYGIYDSILKKLINN